MSPLDDMDKTDSKAFIMSVHAGPARLPAGRSILNNQPSIWTVDWVRTMGIFEGETHFPALCESVAASRTPVLVSKRGRPLVMIETVREELAGGRPDIHTAWRAWKAEHSEVTGDFPEVWRHRERPKGNPLRD